MSVVRASVLSKWNAMLSTLRTSLSVAFCLCVRCQVGLRAFWEEISGEAMNKRVFAVQRDQMVQEGKKRQLLAEVRKTVRNDNR